MSSAKFNVNYHPGGRILFGAVVFLCFVLLPGFTSPAGGSRIIERGFPYELHVEILILMREQADTRRPAIDARGLASNPKKEKEASRHAVAEKLRETAERSQAPLIKFLQAEMAADRASEIKSFSIVNLVYAKVSEELIERIASRPEVDSIFPNETIRLEEPIKSSFSLQAENIEWNIEHIGAPEVWTGIGVDGAGVVIGIIDSGVDWEHEALKLKYRGYNPSAPDNPIHAYNWYDPVYSGTEWDVEYPDDWDGHGTHCAGIALGSDDAENNLIGVAPGASWIAARAFDDHGNSTAEILLGCMQWMLMPTQNYDGSGAYDPGMAPDIVSNSWGVTPGTCDSIFKIAIGNWRNAEILPVFAGGNSGPGGTNPKTIPHQISLPANYAESFAVGATDSQDNLASFSSRGPGACGSFIKPDISAPGVNIRSALSWNPSRPRGYAAYSGTSMAAPHIAGVAALMLSKDFSLNVDQIEEIILSTAIPLVDGVYENSPNYGFGHGLVDALGAVSFDLVLHRLSGSCRYETAVKISRAGWPAGADTVIITGGDNFPDALAGVPLAYVLDAPILLTPTGYLHNHTWNEIISLGASHAIILGGTGAVSDNVRHDLENNLGLTVERIAGACRYETAANTAWSLADEWGSYPEGAFVVFGGNFPDALAAASYAAVKGWPVLLTEGNNLSQHAVGVISGQGITRVVIAGGAGVVSDSVKSELEGMGITVSRYWGASRYETAIALAEEFMPVDADEMFIATGRNFPDALAGAVLAAKRDSGLLLVDGLQGAPPVGVQNYFNGKDFSRVTIFGGPGAVSVGIENWFGERL